MRKVIPSNICHSIVLIDSSDVRMFESQIDLHDAIMITDMQLGMMANVMGISELELFVVDTVEILSACSHVHFGRDLSLHSRQLRQRCAAHQRTIAQRCRAQA
jgi:hypothetical protein